MLFFYFYILSLTIIKKYYIIIISVKERNFIHTMKKEISLGDIIKAMWKKVWLVIILTVVCAVIAYFIAAFFTAPKYTSTTEVFVRNAKVGSQTTSDMTLSKNLLSPYKKVLLNNNLLNQVADEINALKEDKEFNTGFLQKKDYSMSQIKSMIKVSLDEDSQVITINVTANNPKEAKAVNLLLEKYFPDEVKRVINTGEAIPLYEPTLPKAPSSPNITRNTLIGAILGFVLAAAIIILLFMTDSSVHSETDLTEAFEDIPVLGVIPIIQAKDTQAYVSTSPSQKA